MAKDTTEIFAQRLKKRREKEGLSQQQLAQLIKISRGALSFYESGQRTPNIDMLAKTSTVLHVSADWLLGLTDDPTPIPSAVDELNLSSEAVKNLIHCARTAPAMMNIANYIIEDDRFINIIIYLYVALSTTHKFEEKEINNQIEAKDLEKISAKLRESGYAVMDGFWISEAAFSATIINFADIIQDLRTFPENEMSKILLTKTNVESFHYTKSESAIGWLKGLKKDFIRWLNIKISKR